eukprot:3811761-Ditylum_brightwellii.AAC.1
MKHYEETQHPLYLHVQPNVITYSSVLNAYAKSTSPKAPQQAEALMIELEQLYLTTGDKRYRPNIRCYNAIIDNWS